MKFFKIFTKKSFIGEKRRKELLKRYGSLEKIKDVDQIFVLEDGEIKEQGKYQILVRKNGYFKKLYNAKK